MIDLDAMPEADRRKLAEARPDLARVFRETLDEVYRLSDARGIASAKIAKGRAEPKMSAPEEDFYRLACYAVRCGELDAVAYQPEPFALDGKTTYRPDFALSRSDGCGLILVETKSRWMHSENITRLKLRQCSERYPECTWWLARWSRKLPWKIQAVEAGVIRRTPIVVEWLT